MSEKFRNKYRINSARLKNYDYSSNGAYFITIVTKNREHFFGKIGDENGGKNPINRVSLSKIGEIAQKYWQEIPRHFRLFGWMNL